MAGPTGTRLASAAALLLATVPGLHARLASSVPVPPPQPLVFFATADWGGQAVTPFTTPGQLAAASAMGTVAAAAGSHPSFVLAAGDNFYMTGLPAPLPDAASAQRVAATFQDVYTAAGLRVPWYVVAGNHDWVGDVQAQTALNGSAATGGRWNMPSLFYSHSHTLSDGTTAQFVMVDTESLFGGVNAPPPPSPAVARPGGRRLVQSSTDDPGAGSPLDPPVSASWVPPAVNEAQWAWVQEELSSSTADWLFVVGHHPVWSVGEYGPTWELVTRLDPLMQAAGVALYISGHEHQAEHFRAEPHPAGVDYLVVGNGAYYNDTAPADTSHAADCPAGALQFQWTNSTGFAALWLAPASPNGQPAMLSVTIYSGQGKQLYSFYKQNPRAGTMRGGAAIPGGSAATMRASHHTRALGSALLLVVGVGLGLLCTARAAQAQVAEDMNSRSSVRMGTRDLHAQRISAFEGHMQTNLPPARGAAGPRGNERVPLFVRTGRPAVGGQQL
jgi:tartrate-resistant acid phosphatase type 5